MRAGGCGTSRPSDAGHAKTKGTRRRGRGGASIRPIYTHAHAHAVHTHIYTQAYIHASAYTHMSVCANASAQLAGTELLPFFWVHIDAPFLTCNARAQTPAFFFYHQPALPETRLGARPLNSHTHVRVQRRSLPPRKLFSSPQSGLCMPVGVCSGHNPALIHAVHETHCFHGNKATTIQAITVSAFWHAHSHASGGVCRV